MLQLPQRSAVPQSLLERNGSSDWSRLPSAVRRCGKNRSRFHLLAERRKKPQAPLRRLRLRKKVHTTQHFLLRKNSCVALRYIALRNAGNQQLAIQITLHKTADRGGPRVQHHMSGDMSQIHVHLDSSRVTSLITTIVPCIQKKQGKNIAKFVQQNVQNTLQFVYKHFLFLVSKVVATKINKYNTANTGITYGIASGSHERNV